MLIAGISGHICDSCIVQAQAIVKEEITDNRANDRKARRDPQASKD